ncbi:alpha/beta fold hydrolase [Streptosporangium soli]|nr:alpha/beta fold hydrolase [Streptosporangium sp. KLBMP 9127]
MELAFERRGKGSPLLLLHGIGHHWQAWSPVLDRLAACHDVIALDLPGFGASPPLPAGTPYTPEAMADAVDAFCLRLEIRDPHVAGNSLGGYVALDLAARGVVRTATALSPAGFWSRPEVGYARAVLKLMRSGARALPESRSERIARSPAGRALTAGAVVAHPSRLSPEALASAGAALRGSVGFDEMLDALAWVMPPSPPKCPITIAWGEHDRLLLRRQAVRAARWSGHRVKLLKGCGHIPMSDDPALVAQVLLDTTKGFRP